MTTDVATTPLFRPNYHQRVRTGLTITVIGFLTFVLGASPSVFNLDRSPVIGFVQIAVFLVGLAIICLGGYTSLAALWNGQEMSILADIGLRLVATGYVIAVAAGMADVFGFGTQPFPSVPLFGPWQEIGVLIGEAVIGIGFLLLIPYKRPRRENSVENRATGINNSGDQENPV
jgi:hypothetical protein